MVSWAGGGVSVSGVGGGRGGAERSILRGECWVVDKEYDLGWYVCRVIQRRGAMVVVVMVLVVHRWW